VATKQSFLKVSQSESAKFACLFWRFKAGESDVFKTTVGLAHSTVILKTSLSPALNRQNKHSNTNQSIMVAIL